jgi:tetratricopeptide (TPR) repeat protein/DNA-directed RNA polymerase subunit RPC12/RpoP
VVTAQDKALAALLIERGLLDDAAIERARAKQAEALSRGESPPLGQLLVQGGFLEEKIANELLRELAQSSYRCPVCGVVFSYDHLGTLARYRCDRCGQRLERLFKTPTGRFVAASVSPAGPSGAFDALPSPSALFPPKGPSPSSGAYVSVPVTPSGRAGAAGAPQTPSKAFKKSGTRLVGGIEISRVRGSSAAQALPIPPELRLPQEPRIAESGPPRTNDAPVPPRPTKKLGTYEIVSELGRGAMGAVYLAKVQGLERLFAVKVLLGGALADPEAVARFEREAKLASRLQHPAVVSVCGVGTEGEHRYYVMDYCPGRTLQRVIKEDGRKDGKTAAQLVSKMARGLAAAHALGIIHRDVKPANIILDAKTGDPRITDFGLARDASQSHTEMTRTGDLLGTPSYMAPEALVGKRAVDARADIYSLGVILYELTAGVRPYQAETVAHLAARVLMEDAVPLRDAVKGTPLELDAIVMKSLAKEPEKRYQTAAGLADDLDRFLAGEPVLARPEGRLARTWRRSKKTILGAALGVLVLASATFAVWAVGHTMNEEQEKKAKADQESRALQRDNDKVKIIRDRLLAIEQAARLGSPLDDVLKQLRELSTDAPARGKAAVELARAALLARRGQPEAALEAARPFTSSEGKEGLTANAVVLECLLAQDAAGKPTDASPCLDRLEKGDDPTLAQWARLARLARQPGKGAEALELARKEQVSSGQHVPSLRLMARLADEAGNRSGARQIVDKIIGVAPDDARAHLARAILLHTTPVDPAPGSDDERLYKADIDAFFRYAGAEGERDPVALREHGWAGFRAARYDDAAADLEKALAANPKDFLANLVRSWFYDERAEACGERARELDASQADVRPRLDDGAQFDVALTITQAVEQRLVAIAAHALAPAREDLGRALLLAARGAPTEKTLLLFDKAAAASPRCPVVARERARFLMARGPTRRAIEEVARAKGLGASSDPALLRIEMETLDRAGWRDEARAVAVKLFAADPDGVDGLVAGCYVAEAAEPAQVTEAQRLALLAHGKDRTDGGALRALSAAAARDKGNEVTLDLALRAVGRDVWLDPESYYFAMALRTSQGFDSPTDLVRMGDRWEKLIRVSSSAHYVAAHAYNVIALKRANGGRMGGLQNVVNTLIKGILESEPDTPVVYEAAGMSALEAGSVRDADEAWTKAQSLSARWRIPRYLARRVKDLSPELLNKFSKGAGP